MKQGLNDCMITEEYGWQRVIDRSGGENTTDGFSMPASQYVSMYSITFHHAINVAINVSKCQPEETHERREQKEYGIWLTKKNMADQEEYGWQRGEIRGEHWWLLHANIPICHSPLLYFISTTVLNQLHCTISFSALSAVFVFALWAVWCVNCTVCIIIRARVLVINEVLSMQPV